nr:MAG TPA: Receptor Binding Protein [Caudoviricetes sp.]
MSVTFGFFNAQQVNGDYDRKYGADELAEYFASLIGNGISADIENCFKISAVSGMQISIAAGYAWINGYWIKNDADIVKTLAIAPSSNSRVDSVVLRFSKEDRSIEIAIVQGNVSSTPSFKALTRTADVYELMLGYITISAGISAITSSMITDTRSNETYCGIISTFSQKAIPDGSITFVKLANDAVKLQFTDVVVAKAAFAADDTYGDYPYRASVALTGVLSGMIPEVVLSVMDATSGNFAPVAACYDGGIYLYAESVPEAAITIPTILCWKGNT